MPLLEQGEQKQSFGGRSQFRLAQVLVVQDKDLRLCGAQVLLTHQPMSESNNRGSTACYIKNSGIIQRWPWPKDPRPCGGNTTSSVQTCCAVDDICLENSICHTPNGGIANGSGYYTSGCTDPTFRDPACFTICCKRTFMSVVPQKC